jgi:ribonuclease J
MLYRHKEFVKNHLGYADENVIMVENGDVLELTANSATVIEKRDVGRTFIDDSGFEEIGRETVRERKQMAYDGVLTPILTLNEETGALEIPPEIMARGVVGANGSNGFIKNLQRIVTEAVEKAPATERRDLTLLKERVRVELKRYIQKQTGARPVIVPIVVQV